MSDKTPPTFKEMEMELSVIVAWFESEDFDIDEAISRYKRALELIAQLQKHLQKAKNTIEKLNRATE